VQSESTKLVVPVIRGGFSCLRAENLWGGVVPPLRSCHGLAPVLAFASASALLPDTPPVLPFSALTAQNVFGNF